MTSKIAVCSRTFSRISVLREELLGIYPDVTFNDEGLKLEGDQLVDFLSGHDRAIIALEDINSDILARLPKLKVVSKFGVGYDTLDLEALARHGVRVGWKAGVNKRSVSEIVVALSICLLRNVFQSNALVRSGGWKQFTGAELTGKRVGIIGCGHIGKDVVGLLKPFGCEIVTYDIRDYSAFYKANAVEPVGLDELLSTADIVTIHTPLNPSTRHMLDRDALRKMKQSALLINLARGGLVNEAHLSEALQAGAIAGAVIDVFEEEPPTDSALANFPNVLATSHIGGSSDEAIIAMGRSAIKGLDENDSVKDFLRKVESK